MELHTIAVVGVSSKGDVAANAVYKKLRDLNYTVYPVNPTAETIEGDKCYPRLDSIPDNVEGVVIGTHPDITPQILNECIDTGIQYVWIHRSFGQGSFHPDVLEKARKNKLSLIPGGCPVMFADPVDPFHKCFRWFLKISGKEANPIGFMN